MEKPPRAYDFDTGRDSDSCARRQHRSLPSTGLRHTSHGPDAPSLARGALRLASLHLDFLIVGGGLAHSPSYAAHDRHIPPLGIAGLAAAYALAASGHRVRVLEQAWGFQSRSGGIRLPPNATRILSHWGVDKELTQRASVTPSSLILDSEYLGHPFIFWPRARLCMASGPPDRGDGFVISHDERARVTFGATVESVEPAPEAPPENGASTSIAGPSSCTLRPTVRLKTGEILHADVIVGADGLRSIVRRVVTEEDEEQKKRLRKYAPLKQLADVGWPIWTGNRRAVLGYPVVSPDASQGRQHQEFAIHVWWEDHSESTAIERPGALDSWDPTTSLSSLRYREGQMDPRLRFLLDKAGHVSCQPWVVLPQPDNWIDESESIVLIGEAAHPQSPGTIYGCSLALEDAATLGTLFSRIRSIDQVPTLLYAYQDLRKGRTDAVTALEHQNAQVAFSDPQRIRDGLVRWTALPADAPDPHPGSGPTDDELAEIAEVWGYFAIDAADEWWIEWGLLRPGHPPFIICCYAAILRPSLMRCYLRHGEGAFLMAVTVTQLEHDKDTKGVVVRPAFTRGFY
ncbi:hypothetical protein B0F90DRAFT_1668981 [Multifurca ochricompacta]|uniref:FAD-binding domain-containing protein n=1 Tax=Multifurca ochricompacta TaxID=376703 RepID=A0AAD4M291_9AGAM|nr:hypothetical protein B0F90DRAFT_1668981 [Multifurca ochricompacta]